MLLWHDVNIILSLPCTECVCVTTSLFSSASSAGYSTAETSSFSSLHKQHHYTNTWGWSNVGALVSRWVKSGPTLGKLFLLTHNELLLDNESLNYLGKQSLSLGLAVWDGKMRDQLFYINLGYYLHNGDGHFFIFIVTVYTKMSKH